MARALAVVALVVVGCIAPAQASAAVSPPTFGTAPGDADPGSFRLAPAPAPGRSTASTDPVVFFDRADARGGDWYIGANNENGALAWGESFVLDAYLEMYQVTHDTRFLDRFVRHARSVLSQTDEARQVMDYEGRSGPVWRAGARYGYASLLVPGTDNNPIGFLIAKKNQLNSYTYLEVRAGSAPHTFMMRITNSAYGVSEGYDLLVSDRHSANYWVRRINARSVLARAASLRSAADQTRARPKAPTRFDPIFMVHAAHTGLMAYPLAKFGRIVAADASLTAGYGADAQACLSTAVRAVAFHEPEWVDAGSVGYYRFAPGAPIWCDGLGLPYNQNVIMGRALLELFRATGDESYLTKATKIANHFRAGLATTGVNGYRWRYWWGSGLSGWDARHSPSVNTPTYAGFTSFEDIVHASYDIDFMADCVDAGVVFTDADLARVANTMVLTMARPDDIANRVDGHMVGNVIHNEVRAGRWMPLAKVSLDYYDLTAGPLEEKLLQGQPFGAGLYSVALKAAAEQSRVTSPGRAAFAPTVALTQPTVSAARGDLGVSADLGPDAAGADLLVDGMAVPSAQSVGVSSWQVDTASLLDGNRTFSVVVEDAVGRARVASRSVRIDNTPPGALWYSAPPELTPNGDGDRDYGYWSFAATEAGARQMIVVDSAGQLAATPLPWTYNNERDEIVRFDGTGPDGRPLPDGLYTIRVFARDALGNMRTFPAKGLTISHVARWQVQAGRPVSIRKSGTVRVLLSRSVLVGADLVRAGRVVATVRATQRARAGWLSLTVSRTHAYRVRLKGRRGTVLVRSTLGRGAYALRVTVADWMGPVSLTRTVTLR